MPTELALDAFVAAHAPAAEAGGHRPRRSRPSGCTRPARPGVPRARCIRMPTRTGPAELYGKGGAGVARGRCLLLRREAVSSPTAWAMALSFPLSVGATTLLMAERPTPEATFKRWTGGVASTEAERVLRRAHRLCRHAGPPGAAGARGRWRCAWCRRPARRCRRRSASVSRRHFGVDIVDGIGSTEMLHIFLSNLPRQGALRQHRTGRCRATDIELRGDDGKRGAPTASQATCTSSGPSGGDDVLGQPRQDARHLPGRLDQERRQVHPQCRWQLHLRRPQRRHAEGQRHLRQPLRGRSHAGAASGGAGGGGDRRRRCRRADQDQGLRRC